MYVPTPKNGRDAINTAIAHEAAMQYRHTFAVTEILGLMEKIIAMYRSVVNSNEERAAANCPTTHTKPMAGHKELITLTRA